MNTQAELERQIERLQLLLKGRQSLMKKTMRFCLTVLLSICGNQLWAQDQAAFAPVGQKLVEELLARHQPDLLSVSLHVVPPGGTTQVIVAATVARSKIGQQSSCTDLWELANGDGAPALELKGGGGSMVRGVLLGITAIVPLRDQSGATIGLINMGLKFTLGEESEAIRLATSVGQELAAEIPSQSALFEGARKVGELRPSWRSWGDSFEVPAIRACPVSGTMTAPPRNRRYKAEADQIFGIIRRVSRASIRVFESERGVLPSHDQYTTIVRSKTAQTVLNHPKSIRP